MTKACWFCKFFRYYNEVGDWSEITPGSSFEMSCMKNKWKFNAAETSQDDFGKILSTAETCDSYEAL